VVNGESDKSNQFHWPDVKVEGVGADYRKSHPVAWWLALVGPVVISAALLGCIALIQGFDVAYSYAAAAVSAFLFLGRFIILIGQNEPNADSIFFLKHLTASNLFVMLTYMDTMVAMFVAFHMGIIFRLPWVGPRIQGVVSDSQFILRKQPWIRRTAFIGLVGFVIFPSSTTGSVGGSIFGRLLGMKRWRVVVAILVGSILGNGIMLLFSKQIAKYIDNESWTLRLLGVVLMIVVLFVVERKFQSIKAEYMAQEELNGKLDLRAADSSSTDTSENEGEQPEVTTESIE
jgi:uncharacterized membrane protein